MIRRQSEVRDSPKQEEEGLRGECESGQVLPEARISKVHVNYGLDHARFKRRELGVRRGLYLWEFLGVSGDCLFRNE